MAVVVAKRPFFLIYGSTGLSCTVTNSGGDALFTTSAAHGIVTDSHIYISGNLSAYNGEWRANAVSATTFKLRRYPSAIISTNELFVNSGTVTAYTELGINSWNAVHLPMQYVLKSNLWPINLADTARTVSSFSSSNGYTQVILSGDIKASGSANALEQVKISGTPGGLLDGIYRIISWSSDVNFVIDLSYSASNVFTGGTVQYYYGNYHIKVRVYAGLRVGHYWRDQKPFELVAELDCIPDSTGYAFLNINEFVKKQINILENNLLLDTLPNNLDAFCEGYISYAESYDDANQYGTNDLNLTEYTGPYTSDGEGGDGFYFRAINACLPFKTASSALMNGYVYRAGAPMIKFLTGFVQPTLFVGKYFDVSWIQDASEISGAFSTLYMLRRVKDSSGAILHDFVDNITDRDFGVYRYPVAQSIYEEATIELTLFSSSYAREVQISQTLVINVNSDCTAQDFYVTWLNHLGGFDYWNFTGETQYGTNIVQSRTQEKNIFTDWPRSYGEFADSIEKQTLRRSQDVITLNSQYLSSVELDGLSRIVSSPLVQEVASVYDRRTIILDPSSFPKNQDNQKLLQVSLRARYTDKVPSQSL